LMLPNPSIRNLIRENKLFQIPSAMMVGQDKSGMITLNQCLVNLVKKGVITFDAALMASPEQDELVKSLSDLRRRAG